MLVFFNGFAINGSMGIGDNAVITRRQPSLFSLAAWASLFVPLATLAVTILVYFIWRHTAFLPTPSRQAVGNFHASALLADIGGFVIGIFSLCGIRRHGAAFILWKAAPGIVASGLLGFHNFAVMMMTSIFC